MADTDRIAVVGGGPTGLAATRKLAEAGFDVLLIEMETELGGWTTELGCKATDRCANCGACLIARMIREVEASPRVEVLTGAKPTALSGGPMSRKLHVGDRVEPVAGVILATGFRATNPSKIRPEYGAGYMTGSTCGLSLERELRDGELSASPPDSIAFIQCVGSRDRAIGRDYCSRVCCTYALRLARAIHHRLPDVALALFYQDLTPAGPDFGALVDECSGFMRLVRSLPAKVYEDPATHRPTLCYVDTLTGALAEEPFDRVVLSGGMWPYEDASTDAVFALERDAHGFVRGSAYARVVVAGSAKGPMSIAESTDEGCWAAAEMVQRLRPGTRGKVAVLGSDDLLHAVAARIGFEVVRATSVTGPAGAMEAVTDSGRVPVLGGLVAGAEVTPDDGALPPNVSSLWNSHALGRARKVRSLAVLPDMFAPWTRVAAEVALSLAASRTGEKQRTWVIFRHAFTGEMGLEQLTTEAREAGVAFLHIAEPPTIDKGAITVADPVLGRARTIKVDLIVAAAPIRPSTGSLKALAAAGLGGSGWRGGAPANPHAGLSGTSLRGVHVTGWLRDPGASHESARRSVDAALAALALPPPPGTAEVDSAKCAICLTCVRVCPHKAVVISRSEDRRMDVAFIQPEACAGCGLCVTLCPARAITLAECPEEAVTSALGVGNAQP